MADQSVQSIAHIGNDIADSRRRSAARPMAVAQTSTITQVSEFFEIGKAIFYLAQLFNIGGLFIGLAQDISFGIPFMIVSDLVCLSAMIGFLTAAILNKISRSISLGANMIISMYLFYVAFVPVLSNREWATNILLFNMILIVIFILFSGFLIHRRVTLILGFLTVAYMAGALIVLPTEFLEEHFPLLFVVIIGFSLLGFYYRRKLESLVGIMIGQRKTVENALDDLKTAQKQIIVQEKLASLGALTAGIAHEIKNPLNFINNFSESSMELMKELKDHIENYKSLFPDQVKGDIDYLLDELGHNMRDINQHGKRGDAIVRSMLQHSRTGDSKRYPVDLNELIKESANLAYHGYRAKITDFQAQIIYELDPEMEKISLVAHEINRVLLNIITNAFYAVHKRYGTSEKREGIVKISSKKGPSLKGEAPGNYVELRIRDNGTGIPASIQEKIFQPFFTTKPTGEGTGLGLSISYEIITIGHQGSLVIDSKEGEYTEFLLRLPIKHMQEENGAESA